MYCCLYWSVPAVSVDLSETILIEPGFLKAIKTKVNWCDITGKEYTGERDGAIIMAPNLFGTYRMIWDVGPEYLQKSGIKVLTEDEISAMINKEAEERGY